MWEKEEKEGFKKKKREKFLSEKKALEVRKIGQKKSLDSDLARCPHAMEHARAKASQKTVTRDFAWVPLPRGTILQLSTCFKLIISTLHFSTFFLCSFSLYTVPSL